MNEMANKVFPFSMGALLADLLQHEQLIIPWRWGQRENSFINKFVNETVKYRRAL